ncbi:XVIPCD domain-containing protein, partial [Pseudomonas sp. CGJS7]|uniref:XVIPCD domain-containing protein n=1 Tax=Pseudomonas sp. CGJS7 TaxID=3109348 RepID=UPI0030084E0D
MTTQQYANLAQDAYRSPDLSLPEERRVKIAGVEYAVLAHVDKPSGYQGTIYQHVDSKQIVVAHRGSEFDRQPFQDGLIADGGMVAQRVNAQAADALTLTRTALEMARGQYDRTGKLPQVTVTGHSLGGCLAQIAAARFGLNGETFNPYGAVSLAYKIPEGGNQIVNHVMAGDVVSAASKHFGTVRMYAEPVELNVLKAAGYQDNGDRLDLRNPIRAAATGADSHRMHHFLDVDLNGMPDRSILVQRQALELAEQHRPMFDKYRGDIEGLRAGVSVGAAIARGVQGVAGEVGRLLPQKPAESPFKDANQSSREAVDAADRARDPRGSLHPDHPMYQRIRDGIGALQAREGRPFDELSERTAASLLVASRAGGLATVDHVLPGGTPQSGPNVFAIQGDLHDPAHKRAQVSVADAARVSVAESFQQLEAVNAQLASTSAPTHSPDPSR